jgi:hypothetical protein
MSVTEKREAAPEDEAEESARQNGLEQKFPFHAVVFHFTRRSLRRRGIMTRRVSARSSRLFFSRTKFQPRRKRMKAVMT